MDPHADLVAVLVGAAFMGLWLSTRFAVVAPRSAVGAAACLVLAWFIPRLGPPLLMATATRLPLGIAILCSIFPVLVLSFALAACGLRYLVGLAGRAIR
jgi:hypothetical protein